MKEEKFEKVVEWGFVNFNVNGKPIKDNQLLLFLFLFMIPIVGQICWLLFLIDSIICRKVYWRRT
jgi:hypothetical protein